MEFTESQLNRIFGVGGDPSSLTKAAPSHATLRHDEPFFMDTLIHKWKVEKALATPLKSETTLAKSLWDDEVFTAAPATTLAKRAPEGEAILRGDWYVILGADGTVEKSWHKKLGANPTCLDIRTFPTADQR